MSLQVLGARVEEKPIGALQWYVGVCNYSGYHEPVRGWIVCNFVEISRAQFNLLWNEIGATYGGGNGSTTFNVPPAGDGRGPISAGPAVFGWGTQGGERYHYLGSGEEPVHWHNYIDRNGPQNGSGGYNFRVGVAPQNEWGGDRLDTMGIPDGHYGGAAQGHQNMPPVQVIGGLLIRAY